MAEQAKTKSPTKERILLIDDDPIILESLRDLLELDGYEVLAVSSGAEAGDLLDSSQLNLVITNVSMPD